MRASFFHGLHAIMAACLLGLIAAGAWLGPPRLATWTSIALFAGTFGTTMLVLRSAWLWLWYREVARVIRNARDLSR